MGNDYKIVAYRPKNNREIDVTHEVYREGHDIPINGESGLVSTLISAFGELATEDLFKSPDKVIGICRVRV
jgi:hypothetical protein